MNNFQQYTHQRVSHWEAVASKSQHWNGMGSRYHQRLLQIHKNIIPPGKRVLEVGCGFGDLLAGLNPSIGIGIDFSQQMVETATSRHPQMKFIQMDAHEVANLSEKFDYIILSDLVNDLWDVELVFEQVKALCHPGTRIVINTYSRLWQLPLSIARKIGLATPNLLQNWLTTADLVNLLNLSGFDAIRTQPEILLPLPIPLINDFADRFLAKIWPFYWFSLTNLVIARPQPEAEPLPASVSVIIPARNEEGNMPGIFARIPQMGSSVEIIFVEGNSTDQTIAAIEKEIQAHPEVNARLLKQPGKGKGDAVRCGFEAATGDVLMILDADLTVPPEDLIRFYQAIIRGKGEFINGVRLVYPLEQEAMRFFNLLGNKFFSLAFSWLLGQNIKDTLCGTKVCWREDYMTIAANRAYFGEFDPFGDYDLLFGAAWMNLKIVDLPIRYQERKYGTTNISRWKHGMILLKMVAYAATKLKFI